MSRILVVEDDADIASLIVHYLAPAGHESRWWPTASTPLPPRAGARRLVILDRICPGSTASRSARLARRRGAGRSADPDADWRGPMKSNRIAGFEIAPTTTHQAVQPEGAGRPYRARCSAASAAARATNACCATARSSSTSTALVTDGEREVRSRPRSTAAPLFPRASRRVLSRDLLLSDVGAINTPVARARWPSTCGGCAKSCRPRPRRRTIKQFGYKLKTERRRRAAYGDAGIGPRRHTGVTRPPHARPCVFAPSLCAAVS